MRSPPASWTVGILDGQHHTVQIEMFGHPQRMARDSTDNEHAESSNHKYGKRQSPNRTDTQMQRTKQQSGSNISGARIQTSHFYPEKIRSAKTSKSKKQLY